MKNIHEWYREKLGNKVIDNLKKNRFNARYVNNKADSINYLEEIINEYDVIAFGGSTTVLYELKLQDIAINLGKNVLNHNIPNLTVEEKLKIRKKQLTADLFITSTNAVTVDGRLVNIDGTGNRVAAMIFGPKRVVVVCGINKIVENVDEAIKRIKFISAPMNAKRVNSKTPCTETGQCVDCNSLERICNITTIIDKKPPLSNIEIIVIGEHLGF